MITCGEKKETTSQNSDQLNTVNTDYFSKNIENLEIKTVDCTLSNGVKTKCLEITTKGFSADHKMGPWCPETITDSKDKGGVWFKDGKLYDVDGEFIKNLATIYEDTKWMMYDEQGNVKKTRTKEDCEKLAGAQLIEEFTNFCIECLPEYAADLTKTYIIPIQPVMIENPVALNNASKNKNGKGPRGSRPDGPPPGGERPKGPPPGGGRGGPSIRGVALNGIAFDAPAPINLILSGYTIPPLDDAGGHVNMDAGYHYHATTGLSIQIEQADGHAPLIGYAMDGIGLYAYENKDGKTDKDLDDCRGHYDEVRGYHYHVDSPGSNNFINCFSGAMAEQ